VTAPTEPPRIVALDQLLRVADTADRYAIHAGLDARFGRRGAVGYRWTLGQVEDGAAVRVRLPPDHPEAQGGLPVAVPTEGASARFRLVANVTHKDGRSGHRRSWPRDDLAPRAAWLERRAQVFGFRTADVSIQVTRALIGKRKGFWIDATTFTGTLEVCAADEFSRALVGGVGQRGAFGFGLLELLS
jgi:hypothetical protein